MSLTGVRKARRRKYTKVSSKLVSTSSPSNENLKDSIKKLLSGLLGQEWMTAKQLVDCLMSEPYNLEWRDLSAVVDALNEMSRSGLLAVKFKTTGNILGVEVLLSALSLPVVPSGFDLGE
ncbi:MAG: hypothetical protein HYX22_02465 [Candidatus Yanofskybacteria bacterium]|nr:hypothetical protein [Candidatus Yanofskybacteria bacterium]